MADNGPIQVTTDRVLGAEALAVLGKPAVRAFLREAILMARAKWVELAKDQLKTTRMTYIAGIQQPELSPGLASITLVGALPNRLERGWTAYDLHDTLLGDNVPVVPKGSGQRGKHAKKGGGFWRVIPLRAATPGSTGGAVGPAMGSAYRGTLGAEGARALGQRVYNLAKKLNASRETPGQDQGLQAKRVSWGGRLAASEAGPKLKPHHHSPIYAGMVRTEKRYGQKNQSQYGTFRTISTGSPGWRVAGKAGLGLVKKVDAHVSQQAPEAMAQIFKAFDEAAKAKASLPQGQTPP